MVFWQQILKILFLDSYVVMHALQQVSIYMNITQIGLCGAPKISVLRGSHCTVRVSIREFQISVRFVLYIALSKQQWWRCKIIFPLRLAIVNDIVSYL